MLYLLVKKNPSHRKKVNNAAALPYQESAFAFFTKNPLCELFLHFQPNHRLFRALAEPSDLERWFVGKQKWIYARVGPAQMIKLGD